MPTRMPMKRTIVRSVGRFRIVPGVGAWSTAVGLFLVALVIVSCGRSGEQKSQEGAESGQPEWLTHDKLLRAIIVEMDDGESVSGYIVGDHDGKGLGIIASQGASLPVRAFGYTMHLAPEAEDIDLTMPIHKSSFQFERRSFPARHTASLTIASTDLKLVVLDDYDQSLLPQLHLHTSVVFPGDEIKMVSFVKEESEHPYLVGTGYVRRITPDWMREEVSSLQPSGIDMFEIEAISEPTVGAAVFETRFWRLVGFVISEDGRVARLPIPTIERP